MNDSATDPLITVVLPVYNAGAYLRPAVLSILNQTYLNWELLIIDDGSIDASIEGITDISDDRIKILRDSLNRGLPARLNEAIDLARGRFLARMDQDDLSFPERLEKQMIFLMTHPGVDLLGVRALMFNDTGNAIGLFPFRQSHEEICSHPWNGFYLAHPTWMGRIEWFRQHRYRIPEVKKAEDQELLLRTYPTSNFACLPEVLFAYRQRSRIAHRINRQARKSLLRVQMREFYNRKQGLNFLLAITAYFAKTMRDIFYALLKTNTCRSTSEIEKYSFNWESLKTSCRF